MLESDGQPVSMTDVIHRARAWRDEHPTIAKRIGTSIEAMNKSLETLLAAIVESTRNIGYSWGGSDSTQSTPSGNGHANGIEGGGSSRHAPSINLQAPDFGPGSTLGR
jgi:hypothetical protein